MIIEDCLDYPFSEGGDYLSKKILAALEEAGMLPPETNLVKCSDPDIYIKIDNPDAGFTMPSHLTIGWDNE